MNTTVSLEERVAHTSRLWRELANREMPWVWDDMEISYHVGNLLARFLPKVIGFANKLQAKESASGRTLESIYDEIREIMEPEAVFSDRLCWLRDETAEARLAGTATWMEVEEGTTSILSLLKTEAPEVSNDELIENLLLVTVFFEGYDLGLPQTSYDKRKPRFDPEQLSRKIRELAATVDRKLMIESALDGYVKDRKKLQYPKDVIQEAFKNGVLADLVPAEAKD